MNSECVQLVHGRGEVSRDQGGKGRGETHQPALPPDSQLIFPPHTGSYHMIKTPKQSGPACPLGSLNQET
jgi:hypothetical protein